MKRWWRRGSRQLARVPVSVLGPPEDLSVPPVLDPDQLTAMDRESLSVLYNTRITLQQRVTDNPDLACFLGDLIDVSQEQGRDLIRELAREQRSSVPEKGGRHDPS